MLNGLKTKKESVSVAHDVLSHISKDGYRDVIMDWFKKNDSHTVTETHPLLKEAVGLYEVRHVYIPQWFNIFKQTLIEHIAELLNEHDVAINNEIMEYTGDDDAVSKKAKKVIDFIKNLNRVTVEDFAEGKLPNGQKIIKSAISAIEVGTGKKDLGLEKSKWYTLYEKNKQDDSSKKIIISDSIISKLGISNQLISGQSCQSIVCSINQGDNNGAIFNFVADPFSVVAYEIDLGDKTKRLPGAALDTHAYKWRSIIRLVEVNTRDYLIRDNYVYNPDVMYEDKNKYKLTTPIDNKYKGYALMMDAFYPSAKDIKQMYTVLKEIGDRLGLPIVMPSRGHYTQSGSSVVCTIKKEEPMLYGTYGSYPRLTKACKDKCSKLKSISACESCSVPSKEICELCKVGAFTSHFHMIKHSKCSACEYKSKCKATDCDGCHHIACENKNKFRAHYMDQLGGTSTYPPQANSKNGELCDGFKIITDIEMS